MDVSLQYLMDPHKVAASLDATVNNPLSLNDEVSVCVCVCVCVCT